MDPSRLFQPRIVNLNASGLRRSGRRTQPTEAARESTDDGVRSAARRAISMFTSMVLCSFNSRLCVSRYSVVYLPYIQLIFFFGRNTTKYSIN